MKIWLAPSGKLISGHVLDCAVAPLVEKMQHYDPQLYVKWNPKKLKGWGCWEVRRRPEFKKIKEQITYAGNTYTILEYMENGFDNHIMDVPYLNYKILEKLSEIDTWKESYRAKNFAKELEYKEAKAQEKLEDKSEEQKNYMIKQHKSQIRDMKEFVLSGGNPYRIADVWDK